GTGLAIQEDRIRNRYAAQVREDGTARTGAGVWGAGRWAGFLNVTVRKNDVLNRALPLVIGDAAALHDAVAFESAAVTADVNGAGLLGDAARTGRVAGDVGIVNQQAGIGAVENGIARDVVGQQQNGAAEAGAGTYVRGAIAGELGLMHDDG